jgi:cob(I)alamin adenosyltransferase
MTNTDSNDETDDAEGSTDIETDAGTDAEETTDAEADADSDAGAEGNSDASSDAEATADAEVNDDAKADSKVTGNTEGTADAEADAGANTEATDDADSEATADANTDADTESDADAADESPKSTIEPAAPEEFGLVQVWWGDGKGKTTASLGMGFRAAGHGYRVHLLQFMKGGAGTVEDARGEYAAIEVLPTFTYERTGEYGWHGFSDGSDDDEHAARAKAALARAREAFDEGYHMLVLDEVLYAANRELVEPDEVRDLIESKPDDLELVLTGGHDRPEYATDLADLVTHVGKEKHPIDAGQGARKGTEY